MTIRARIYPLLVVETSLISLNALQQVSYELRLKLNDGVGIAMNEKMSEGDGHDSCDQLNKDFVRLTPN